MPSKAVHLSRHAAIAQALREQIRSGELTPGSPLPSESQLTDRFAVSRGTVRQALAALRAEGLIAGGRGRVPVIRRAGLAQSFDQLVSFSLWARQIGRNPSARTFELTRRRCDPEAAEQLAIEPGAPIFFYTRLRLLDGAPVLVERATFVESVGRLLLDCDLDGGSVYEQLGQRGVEFAEAQQTICAIAAGAEDAALLEVARRSPLLEVRRRAAAPDGTPLEWSRDRYRADAFEITLHNQHALPGAGVALRAARNDH
ncbi:MAG: GntR family transcriptional regulator [Solirubrobacterales bacterium]|nr:GntR family transcriptional regulator [Solirubrobacterales bacterium]